MKNLLYVLIFFAKSSFAQLPTKDGKVYFEVIDSLKGTKQELFVKSKFLLANFFKDFKEVIQMEDKESGTLFGKGALRYNYQYKKVFQAGFCDFSFQVTVKDDKYRIKLYDFGISQGGYSWALERLNNDYNNAVNKTVVDTIHENTDAFLSSFKKGMSEKQKQDDF